MKKATREMIARYEGKGYKLDKVDNECWCITARMKKITAAVPDRDPFGNATGEYHERVAYVDITEYSDGEIEVTR